MVFGSTHRFLAAAHPFAGATLLSEALVEVSVLNRVIALVRLHALAVRSDRTFQVGQNLLLEFHRLVL